MNHDTSPPPSAQLSHTSPRPDTDADPHDATLRDDASNGDEQHRSPSRSERRRRRRGRKKRNPGLVKKLAFVTHLLKTLDLVVFAELSSLYYMECSMVRFALRAAGQYMYLTPKDETFPFLMPATRVHVFLIVVPNIVCLLLHLFAALPQGPDFHRGYQHGGLVIDFIGQKPATSRAYYLLADLAILAVQCLMLAIHNDRESLRATLKTFRPFLPELAVEAAGRSAEDLDAEERGVSRHERGVSDEADGVELQPLWRDDGDAAGGRRTMPSGDPPGDPSGDESRSHLADLMSSGNAAIGEYHVVHSLRTAAVEIERTAAHSLQTIGYRATMAAIQAQRRRTVAAPNPASG